MHDADTASLESIVERFVRRTERWTARHWSGELPDGGSRADAVAGLVQQVAELAADAEGVPRRVVPRAGGPTVLPDKLRVIAADLSRTGDSVRIQAAVIAIDSVQDRT